MSSPLNQYLDLLKVEPGATLQEIDSAYYTLLEEFSESPTEEEEERQNQIRHAYGVARRACQAGAIKQRKHLSIAPGRWIRPLAVLGVLAVGVAVTLNMSSLQMVVTEYEPGDVLRWQDEQKPYGEVLAYDAEHRFHTGSPSAAYQIRLVDGKEVQWLGERVVEKGMRRIDPDEVNTASMSFD